MSNSMRNMIKIAAMACFFVGVSACTAVADNENEWQVSALNSTADILEQEYIYEEKGAELASFLRDNHSTYSDVEDKSEFARRVTLDLYELANDKHLRIDYEVEDKAQAVKEEPDVERPHITYCENTLCRMRSLIMLVI